MLIRYRVASHAMASLADLVPFTPGTDSRRGLASRAMLALSAQFR